VRCKYARENVAAKAACDSSWIRVFMTRGLNTATSTYLFNERGSTTRTTTTNRTTEGRKLVMEPENLHQCTTKSRCMVCNITPSLHLHIDIHLTLPPLTIRSFAPPLIPSILHHATCIHSWHRIRESPSHCICDLKPDI
jgi:hypothetical protein